MGPQKAFEICLKHFENHTVSPQEAEALQCLYEIVYPNLGDAGKARRNDPRTSKKAALAVKAENQRGRILRSLESQVMTSDEVAQITGIFIGSVTPRIAELKSLRLVRSTGQFKLSGRQADQEIWMITELGKDVIATL